MKKTPQDCMTEIHQILSSALNQSLITTEEVEATLSAVENGNGWDEVQPTLDMAQNIDSTDALERLRMARTDAPLYRSDFTTYELEVLKSLAPAEVEMMRG